MGLTNCFIDYCLLMRGHARPERRRPPERHSAECPIFFQVQVGPLCTLCEPMSLYLGFWKLGIQKQDTDFLELNWLCGTSWTPCTHWPYFSTHGHEL
jgi:hypothetical protein